MQGTVYHSVNEIKLGIGLIIVISSAVNLMFIADLGGLVY
jgi:hypothetical protein